MTKFSLLLLSAGCIGILASTAHAETLQDSIATALVTHPSVEAALATGEAQKETVKEEKSGYYPTINVNASGARAYIDNSTSRGLTTDRGAAYTWVWEGGASVNQTIYDGFETSNRIKAAQARNIATDLSVVDVKENLALQATQSYVEVLRTGEVLIRANEHYKSLNSYLERIQTMVDEGIADEAELAQAKSLLLQMDDLMADFEGQRENALVQYKQIIGRMPEGQLETPVFAENLMPGSVDDAVNAAKQTHPLVQVSAHQLEAANYSIDAEKAGLHPGVTGELSFTERDQKEQVGGEFQDARAMVRVDWGFETGGAQKARENRVKAEYRETLARQKESIRQIEGDVRRAYVEYETAKKQQIIAAKREKIVTDLSDAYKTQFEGARVRLLQLMQAENQLFSANLDTVNANYRYMAAQYGTLASIGQLQKSFAVATASR